MNLTLFIITLISILKLVVLQNPSPLDIKYHILLTLKKFNIQPSRGLCKEIGMKKVQGTCAQHSDGFLKLRRQDGKYSERTLCGILKLPFCGNTCCLSEGVCQQNRAIVINEVTQSDQQTQSIECSKTQHTLEKQCISSGLLWCASQCCGFSANHHKCFRTNHYGVAYVRCPIEADQS